VTGEASGDLHGANLIRAAALVDPGLSFFGVGGKRMAEAGCDILIPSEKLAVMGLVEVLANIRVISRAMKELRAVLEGKDRPDVLILIDYPGFNLRLAAYAKKAGVPVLYYISPKVWAWRQGRVKRIASVVDKLALIFPFEEKYFQGLDVDVEYVGNPLMDEVQHLRDRGEVLRQHGIEETTAPVVGLFPGSRRNEIRYNFSTLVQSAKWILREKPAVRFLLPVAPSLDREMFQALLAEESLPVILTDENIYDVAHACDAVICVSGTVTLQTALADTPMAVVYKMAPLSFAVAKRLVKIAHVSLVNIVAEQAVVKEFLQDEATADKIGNEILRILDCPEYRDTIRQGLSLVKKKIGSPGCSARVAQMASAMSRGMGVSSSPGRLCDQ